ncbi:thiol:disulfide interchange protein DsbA/DsbL [Teredinibacter turnerae]|uniref:thiol:disulfide interchange protein DsbA/DsbL n=1 Tax=Teredinibacter turnerae TaxID=2426 RepID=UPI00037C2C33|nr:thiol:disulfide interchange protein DsbA/DsbL [Teredinibacter turnerae]
MRHIAALIALVLFLGACGDKDASVASVTPSLIARAEAADSPAGNFVQVQYQEGREYTVLAEPVKTVSGDKIEVTEFFSYGCIHCFHFETAVHAWEKNTMPAGVEFVQTPAVFNKAWEHYARTFYAAKALGVWDKAHPVVFDTIHVKRKRLGTVDEMAELFTSFGVKEDDFKKAYSSFGVTSQVQAGDARARAAGLRGTPELMVDGRYKITTGSAGGHEQMFQVANFLIDKIKRERK